MRLSDFESYERTLQVAALGVNQLSVNNQGGVK